MSFLVESDVSTYTMPPTGKKPLNAMEYRTRMVQRLAQLDLDRERLRPQWRDLQKYILPEFGFGLQGTNSFEQNDYSKKYYWIIDSTATMAVDVMAAGMQSGMTSPSRPWMRLRIQDEQLMQWMPVKVWLRAVEDAIYRIFSSSNFYGALHQGYSELGVFGTWANLIEENDDTIIRCRPMTAGEYWIGLNDKLEVDVFYRRLWANAAQIVGEFGKENVSSPVLRAYESNQLSNLFEVIQSIEFNDDRYFIPECKGKTYRSAYFERSGEANKLLRINGYYEMPTQTPRWAVIGGKTYGNSRGMCALGDVKMLQKISQKQLENLDKSMDPPLVAPTAMKNDNINTLPGGVSFSDDLSAGNNSLRPLYQVQHIIDAAQQMKAEVQERINKGFFSNLFLQISQEPTRSNVTAEEIAQRHEEVMLVLGPVIERLGSELLSPAITRTLALANRAGFIPTPPKEIAGMPLHIEYVSILAQAQKMVGIGSTQQFVGSVAQMAQIFGPQVLDTVNSDKVVYQVADLTGLDPNLLNSQEVVTAIRAQRQKQQQIQQQQQAMLGASTVAKNLGGATLGPDTALGAITGRLAPSPVPAET